MTIIHVFNPFTTPPELKALKRLVALLRPKPAARQSRPELDRLVAAGFRWTPTNVDQLDATLQAEFEPAQLLATGCYQTDATGRLQLIDSLRLPDAPVAVVTQAPRQYPSAIVASDRPANLQPTTLDYLLDDARRLRAEVVGGVWLAVAGDDDAFEWLRRTNLAAVPIEPLREDPALAEKFWKAFFAQQRFDVQRRNSQPVYTQPQAYLQFAQHPPYIDPMYHARESRLGLDAILVLPAWDCRSFTLLADGGASELKRLRQLLPYAPRCYSSFGVWTPSAETLRLLRPLSRGANQEVLFDAAVKQSLANDIRFLPVDRAAPAPVNENPNDLRRQLQAARTYEDFDDLKRRYRTSIEQSLLAPAADDDDLVDAQRKHVGNALLRQFADAELEISLSRDRHPFSSGDRSATVSNVCKLATAWLDVQTAGRGGRHARRRR